MRSIRRRTRGAALVESTMVMPIMAMLFAGIIHLGNMYIVRLETMHDSRWPAWHMATGGYCNHANPLPDFALGGPLLIGAGRLSPEAVAQIKLFRNPDFIKGVA